ncbi:hypothetical protein H6P81_013430 [Aristolochia fimbriata]|uniref:Uncharacterized protein n=1 Tax=Aristolochia fimbriata TaxID=158543 RepID=A0AAV7EHY8_ARIFI|nr:hypothetical protein H6P81_013430 [Aristolochia fimbriata]
MPSIKEFYNASINFKNRKTNYPVPGFCIIQVSNKYTVQKKVPINVEGKIIWSLKEAPCSVYKSTREEVSGVSSPRQQSLKTETQSKLQVDFTSKGNMLNSQRRSSTDVIDPKSGQGGTYSKQTKKIK